MMTQKENISGRGETVEHRSERKMAQFTLDYLLQRKEELEQKLANLGSDGGYHRAALHDDSATETRKDEIRATLGRIGDLSRTEIIEPRQDVSIIGVGNQVSLLWEGEDQPENYLLLGPDDQNYARDELRVISYESPVGAAILGKKEGDTAIYASNDREIRVKIVAIELGNF